MLFFTTGFAFETFEEFEGVSKELEVLGAKNHKLYFNRIKILRVILDFFSTKYGIML